MLEFHTGGSASNRASLFSFLVVAGIYLSGNWQLVLKHDLTRLVIYLFGFFSSPVG